MSQNFREMFLEAQDKNLALTLLYKNKYNDTGKVILLLDKSKNVGFKSKSEANKYKAKLKKYTNTKYKIKN